MEVTEFTLDIDHLIKNDPCMRLDENIEEHVFEKMAVFSKRQEKMEREIRDLQILIKILSTKHNLPITKELLEGMSNRIRCECGIMISKKRATEHRKTNKHKYNMIIKTKTNLH